MLYLKENIGDHELVNIPENKKRACFEPKHIYKCQVLSNPDV